MMASSVNLFEYFTRNFRVLSSALREDFDTQ